MISPAERVILMAFVRDKYNREKVVRKVVPLYPADSDVAERIAEVGEPFATYVKRLIREDASRDSH